MQPVRALSPIAANILRRSGTAGHNEQAMTQTPLSVSPSASALRSAQRNLDRRIEAALTEERHIGTPLLCAAGCFHCCDMPIIGTYIEAEAAVQQATPRMLTEHAERARAVLALAQMSLSEENYIGRYRATAGFCPFLVDGRCGVYPARPGKCRSTYSTRAPAFCTDGGILALQPAELQNYVAENEANPRVEGFTHYLVSTEVPVAAYQRALMSEARRRHGGIIHGDWSVMVTLAADQVFRQNMATAGRNAHRVQAVLQTHPLAHALTVRFA